MDICEMCQRHNTFLFCDDCDELSNFVIKPVYRAAPDMYEALIALVRHANCEPGPIPEELWKRADKALEKAEGK